MANTKGKKVNISINGDEKYKSEIVYNNIMNTMDEKNISKEEQLNYFKEKLTLVEAAKKNTIKQVLIIIAGLVVLVFGIFLTCINFYTLGIIFTLLSFFATILVIIKFTNNTPYTIQSKKFEEIETLRKIIDSKIK